MLLLVELAAPAAALVDVITTLSPAFRPLVISVVLSPATPVVTRAVLPSLSVTVFPRRAWVGTVRPLAWSVTMSALAVIPGLSLALVWVRRRVTG